MTISILLADDHQIFRQGLHLLLSRESDFEIVGEAQDGLQAILLAEKLHPDIAIIDILMPGLNGMDATIEIKKRLPDTKVIILSMHDDESYILNVLNNGASAYVLKESSMTDLVQAVRFAMSGLRFLSSSLNQRAINVYAGHDYNNQKDTYNELTYREREVLHLSAEGLNCPKIAERLCLSTRTVEAHRSNMMRKLKFHTQADLVNYAHQHKIISPGDPEIE
jgi:two-component system, NarL family, response regulator NreC